MKISLTIFLGIGLVACGGSKKKSGDETTYTTVTPSITQTTLALAAPSAYTAEISGCVSGFSNTSLTEADTSPTIPDFDSNCQFKLSSVTVSGETFTINVGSVSFAQGASFLITGSGGTEMNFTVTDQIDSPISGPQTVAITFAPTEAGTSSSVDAVTTTAGVTIDGANPINLELDSSHVAIQGIDGTTGAGSFGFRLLCDTAVAAGQCDGVDLTTISSGLVNATGYTLPLSAGDCSTIAGAANYGSQHVVGNGGLLTPTLVGPAPIYDAANSSLLLAILSSDGACKYFEITVNSP